MRYPLFTLKVSLESSTFAKIFFGTIEKTLGIKITEIKTAKENKIQTVSLINFFAAEGVKLTPQDKLVILPRKYKFRSLKELILVKLKPKVVRSDPQNDGTRNFSLNIGDLPSQNKKEEDCFIRDGSLYGKKRKMEERYSQDAPNYKKKLKAGRETVINDINQAKKEIQKLEDETSPAALLDSDLKYYAMVEDKVKMMKKMKDKIQKAFEVLKKKMSEEEERMKKMLNEINDSEVEQ